MAAVPPIDGVKTKNVFLRDAKGNRHILVVVPHDRRVDLLALARVLPSTKLSMGSPERLQRHLGVTPGAVSVFSLVNDSAAAVELILDEEIWHAERVQGHPLRNTATVSISHAALATFFYRM
ncbi:YbaK/EbsC family protein [Undibacterium arcticum]